MAFSIEKVRAQFPALAQDQVFMDNAGGSQVLSSVIDSIAKYLKSTNVYVFSLSNFAYRAVESKLSLLVTCVFKLLFFIDGKPSFFTQPRDVMQHHKLELTR